MSAFLVVSVEKASLRMGELNGLSLLIEVSCLSAEVFNVHRSGS